MIKLCPFKKNENLSLKIKWLESINGGKKVLFITKNKKKINLRVNLTRNEDTPEFYRGIFRKQKREGGRKKENYEGGKIKILKIAPIPKGEV